MAALQPWSVQLPDFLLASSILTGTLIWTSKRFSISFFSMSFIPLKMKNFGSDHQQTTQRIYGNSLIVTSFWKRPQDQNINQMRKIVSITSIDSATVLLLSGEQWELRTELEIWGIIFICYLDPWCWNSCDYVAIPVYCTCSQGMDDWMPHLISSLDQSLC